MVPEGILRRQIGLAEEVGPHIAAPGRQGTNRLPIGGAYPHGQRPRLVNYLIGNTFLIHLRLKRASLPLNYYLEGRSLAANGMLHARTPFCSHGRLVQR
jgi:hypothetical protein